MACPDAGRWLELAEGDPPDREALRAHAESCAACRSLLAGALADPEPVPEPLVRAVLPVRRAFPWVWAAAAGLLLAFWAARPWNREFQPVLQAPVAEAVPVERVVGLGRCGSLVLSGGARASVEGGRVRLESGALLATARGERVEVLCGEGTLVMETGEAVVEIAASRPSLVREAGAAEGDVAIRVLSGTARWGDRILKAGEGIGAATFRAGWISVQGAEGALNDAFRALGPAVLPPAYAWEVVLRRSAPEAGLTLRLPAGGKSWDLALGEHLLGTPGERIRIAATVGGGWLRLEIAGREAGACRIGSLGSMAVPAEGGPGIKVLGAEAGILEARWRRLE